jgi:phage terminase large subunit-like protein
MRVTAALALVDRLRALPAADRRAILAPIPARRIAALRWCWREFWARPDAREPGAVQGRGQLPPPGRWAWWAQIGGRGSGKTRSGAQWVQREAERLGRGMIVHLVGATVDDVRDIMIEGQSGILACAPPWCRPVFKPSVRGGILEWPNGARGRVFGADKPSKGRGPQCNRMWVDDPAAFHAEKGKKVLDQLLFGFRLRAPDGSGPKGTVTSTPIDTELLRWFLGENQGKTRIVYSTSISDDNFGNLSAEDFEATLAEFAGTELEQQERFGVMGAFRGTKVFKDVDFAPARVAAAPKMKKIVISVDPSMSGAATACEVGITVGGIDARGHGYGLADLSCRATSAEWPRVVVEAVDAWDADEVLVETNKGTSWPETLLNQAEKLRRAAAGLPLVSMLKIVAILADKTKATRAGTLVPLYRQGMLHHVAPGFEEVERQLRVLDEKQTDGTDRGDAWVQLVIHLLGGKRTRTSSEKERAPLKAPDARQTVGVMGTRFGEWR